MRGTGIAACGSDWADAAHGARSGAAAVKTDAASLAREPKVRRIRPSENVAWTTAWLPYRAARSGFVLRKYAQVVR
jgi:hypothetical protein